jgi:hypothetical protein
MQKAQVSRLILSCGEASENPSSQFNIAVSPIFIHRIEMLRPIEGDALEVFKNLVFNRLK